MILNRTLGLMCLLFLGSIPTAQALVQDIEASFRPDPTSPQKNEFKNTTPESGICPWHIPSQCKAMGIFTIRTNALNFHAKTPILANHTDPRQGAMWKVPSEWRDVPVMHEETGESSTVQMRIAGIGHRWDIRPHVEAWAQPGVAWQSMWRNAPAPCTGVNYLAAGTTLVLFFWIVPENAGVCNRIPSMDITAFWYSTTEYAYALKTPNPLKMASGKYTGTITYSVGPGKDFDMGDVMIPTDEVLTFNFTLDVDHILKVDIPPGGNTVELIPQGGWQAWLNQGRKPAKLFRDQTVNLYASSRFKMQLECQYAEGDSACGVKDSVSGHAVPVNVSVSMPYGITDALGRPVNRLPLRRDGVGTELFQPTQYVDRKPSTLHFEIPRDAVEQMLQPGAGRTYSGSVTVIWDSQL
ncbi:hypothetical protein [Pseudomonas fildesensis]|uniref:Fimbrial protein n=1 Tax=Pseudomonas fildesensis TaxID=1674920 RepID=A0A0J8G4X5_9PSED|nr:hypothetical protein [Pseudomonas fildesensis]KMT57577.1 hypothetical protein ACR52_02825 [Pseudomonas fildesensis]